MILKGNQIIGNDSHCQGLFAFENGMSNTAKNPLSATWIGTPYYSSTAKFGSKSLDLSSTNVLYSTDFVPKIIQGFFISFFIYLKGVPTSNAYPIAFRIGGSANLLQIIYRTDGTFSFNTRQSSSFYYPAEDRPILSLNIWHFIVLYVIEPTKILMIIDGNITQTTTLPTPYEVETDYTLFNSYYDPSTFRQVNGYMDSLQIKTGVRIPESALYTTKNRES